jgi:hypothetical protein
VTITVTGDFTDVDVYTGSSVNALTEVACGDNYFVGPAAFSAAASTTYRIQLGTDNASFDPGNISIDVDVEEADGHVDGGGGFG